MGKLSRTVSDGTAVRKLRLGLVVIALTTPSILIVFASISSEPVMAVGWGPRVLVSDDNMNNIQWSAESAVATDTFGNVYVVWSDSSELDGTGSDSDIFLRKWNSSNQRWGVV